MTNGLRSHWDRITEQSIKARVPGTVLLALAAFATTANAGDPFKLSGAPLTSGSTIISDAEGIAVTRDFVVFVGDLDTNNREELYSRTLYPLTPRVKLNDPLLPITGRIMFFAITPDESRVVYAARQDLDGFSDIFSVPIGGGTVTRLTDYTTSDYGSSFRLSSDGATVVYRDETTGAIFTVPTLGGAAASPLTSVAVSNWEIASDDSFVVFRTSTGLFSIRLDGSASATQLSEPFTPDQSLGAFFELSADGAWVAYHQRNTPSPSFIDELYSAPTDGSSPAVKLSGVLLQGDVEHFGISPDSSTVVYQAREDTPGIRDLYAVPIDGSASSVRISGALPPDGDVVAEEVLFAPGSSRVFFMADATTDNSFDLFSVAIDGLSAPTQVNDPLPFGGVILDYRPVPGGRVVYRTNRNQVNTIDLYTARIGGVGTPTQISPVVPIGRAVDSVYSLSSNGAWVLYRVDVTVQDQVELYASRTNGEGVPECVSGPMVAGGSAQLFRPVPGRRLVVYTADQEQNDAVEVFGSYLPAPQRTRFLEQQR